MTCSPGTFLLRLALAWALAGCRPSPSSGDDARSGGGEPAGPDAGREDRAPDVAGPAAPSRPDGAAASDAPTREASASGVDAGAPPIADATVGPVPVSVPGPPRLIRHAVAPRDTDARIDRWTESHLAYVDTRVPLQGRLVVYLVGARGLPQGATTALEQIAAFGFHVVGPRYPNDVLVLERCVGDPDPECHRKIRAEVFDGQDESPHAAIGTANGIENRLTRLVQYLAERYADQGWGHFLDGGGLRWSHIAVTGHSYGAAMAAYASKVRGLHRAVMLSGPVDTLNDGKPAPWTDAPGRTPPERLLGFSHTGDDQHGRHLRNWEAMGMTASGPVTSVDRAEPPYGRTTRLVSSETTRSPHEATAPGSASPRAADGSFRYLPAWRYLYGP